MKKPFVLWNWMFLCLLLCVMCAAAENELKEVTWPADSLTLQEAYDKTAEDGTLTILRGVHDVPETLVIRKNITITGQSTNRDYTVLKGGKQNVLRLETGFAEIKNLTIKNEGDSQDSGTSVVRIHAPLCAFENCLFTSEKSVGFLVDQKDSSPIVTRCTAKNCGSAGFFVCNGASGTFTDCEASGNADAGILVQGSGTNPTVEKCRFMDSKENCGIYVYDGASGTFTDCEASGNALDGIEVRDSGTNPTVEKCRSTNNQEAGIFVYDGASGTFTDCEASGNAYSGIQVLDSGTNPTVEKCRFMDNQEAGIGVCDGASGTFTDCEASGNALSGIGVGDSGTNPTVEKCRFTNNQEAGIFVFQGASGTFTDCEASGNAYSGIDVRDSGTNPTVEKCRFMDSKKGSGIYIWQGASGTFRNNTLSGNAKNWYVEDGSSPVRVGNTPNG